jgi:hypothetical protein
MLTDYPSFFLLFLLTMELSHDARPSSSYGSPSYDDIAGVAFSVLVFTMALMIIFWIPRTSCRISWRAFPLPVIKEYC